MPVSAVPLQYHWPHLDFKKGKGKEKGDKFCYQLLTATFRTSAIVDNQHLSKMQPDSDMKCSAIIFDQKK